MYYVHGRWYRPDLGQFISPDEKGAYSYNPNQDPVNQALGAGGYCYSGDSQYLPIVPSLPVVTSIKPVSRNDLKALQYKALIKKECATYGVPWQIVAGVLESEIQLDTEPRDYVENVLVDWFPAFMEGRNVGPGIANFHILTLRATTQYFNDQYMRCDPFQLGVKVDDSTTNLSSKLLNDSFSIRALTAQVRLLADYRFGSNDRPLLASHANLSGWTLADGVAIWHGYRYGVPRITPGGQGFRSLGEFQDRTLNLEEFILLNIVGEKNPQESARASIQYFLAYWFMPE